MNLAELLAARIQKLCNREFVSHFSIKSEDISENAVNLGIWNRIFGRIKGKICRPENTFAYNSKCNSLIEKKEKLFN